MKGRICLFAKTPALGKVKTRLEPSIGKQGCLDLHKWLVGDRLKLAKSNLGYEFQVHVTDSVDDEYWKIVLGGNNFPCASSIHLQLGSNLGARMAHVSSDAELYSWTILIGADCPDLDQHYLNQAIDLLNKGNDAVVGPAEDGGYVLLGFKSYIPELFEFIDWGTDQVLSQTLSVLDEQFRRKGKLEYSKLSPLRDLDLIDDLQYYLKKHPELQALDFSVNSPFLL